MTAMKTVTRATVGRAYELCERAEHLCYDGKLSPHFVGHLRRIHRWAMAVHQREYIMANKPRLAAALEKAKAKRK